MSQVDPQPKLVTLCVKLIQIGAKVVRYGRYVAPQLAEVAVSRDLFRKILSPVDMICNQDPLRRRPRKSTAREIPTGEVRLDDDKIGRMGFCTSPTDEN